MKLPRSIFYLFSVLLLGSGIAAAQTIDAYGGAGTASASSTGVPIDTFGDGTLYPTPSLHGTFLTFGGTVMFRPHFGVGAETSFRASRSPYAGLEYRPTFYDFNGVYHPLTGKRRVVPEFQAGIGAVNLKYYYTQQSCDSFVGCSSSSSYLESSTHFQVHFAAGLQVYVKGNFFIRPQVDAHYVNNFFQFGTNWVPEYGAVIGYTFGR